MEQESVTPWYNTWSTLPFFSRWAKRLLLAPRRFVRSFVSDRVKLDWDLNEYAQETRKLKAELAQTQSKEERDRLEGEISFLGHLRRCEWEEYEARLSRKLVAKALRLSVGGWPEEEHFYEDKERSEMGLTRLNDRGIAFLREKIRKEEAANRAVWKEWITILGGIAGFIAALAGLGGVVIGILSAASC